MQNPILAMLTGNSNKASKGIDMVTLRKLVLIAKFSKNPEQAVMQFISNNPNLSPILPLLQSGNPRDIFYQKAKELGVEPDQILQIIQTMQH